MRWRHPILAAAILAAIPLATIAGLSLAHAAVRRSTSPAPITLPYSPKIDPANFAAAVDNRYFPLKPGTTLRYRGVAELMPFARGVSAKSHDFDAAGNETHTDYKRMLRIVLDAGYHGYLGIEYEGDGVSEREGIRLTKALLERVRAELHG